MKRPENDPLVAESESESPPCPSAPIDDFSLSSAGRLIRVGLPSPSITAESGEAGREIGPYRLLVLLGEGGFGSVWRAEQDEPIRREVALKLVRPGMGSREVLSRFEAERQALALMDHPNIAAVLDAGQTETGQPWFAMELVEGMPITEYCDAKRLTIPERLRLFVPLCLAVQHAHQKGVLHRDLKPSNILVEETDGRPVPKIIDFGIAKALDSAVHAPGLSLLVTRGVATAGTPLYMSPEQAGLHGLDIDSRSDVYSLGVVLYELLTGSTPLSFDEVGGDLPEVFRRIREADPPSPRRRAGELGADCLAICEARQTDPRRLVGQLRGDLEWIALKALEKDRERRYASAAALAEDLERHFRSEPVNAGPPTAAYRIGRLARRHRGALAAAGLVMLALASGAGIAAWQALRATRAERAAEARLVEALEERRRADAEAARAQAVADFLKNDLLRQGGGRGQSSGGHTPNPNLSVRELVERSASGLEERFGDQPVLRAELNEIIGGVYLDLGLPAAAVAPFRKAHALFSEERGEFDKAALECLNNLGTALAQSGSFAESISLLSDLRERLLSAEGAEGPGLARVSSSLGHAYLSWKKPSAALPFCEEAVSASRKAFGEDHFQTMVALNNLAGSLGELGRNDEALSIHRSVLDRREKFLGPEHPLTISSKAAVGASLLNLNRADEAIKLFTELLEQTIATRGEDHPDTIRTLRHLAMCHDELGSVEEAGRLFTESLERKRRVLGEDHPDTITGREELAYWLRRNGRPGEAVVLLEEAVISTKKVHGETSPLAFRRINALGAAMWAAKDFRSSVPLYESTLAAAESSLGPDHPETINTLANLGVNYCDAGRKEEGVEKLAGAWRRAERLPGTEAKRFAWVKEALEKRRRELGAPALPADR
jgi:serine/threonine protein kinase